MRHLILPSLWLTACTGTTEKTTGNSAPEVVSLRISGDTFSTSDTLFCEALYQDADNDVVTEAYEWTNQRGDIIGSTQSVTLQVGVVEPMEMINCMVTLNDGQISVSEITSATITNTNPTVDTVTIDPTANITPESTLSCSATASDVDGGSPTLSYSWERNNIALASTSTLSLPVLGNAAMGDTFTCIATALDEFGGEGRSEASVTVGNSPPSIDGVRIVVANNPDLPFTSQLDVECVADGILDPNDDVVTLAYQWFLNGDLQVDSNTSILEAPFSVSDEIGCRITPSDGFDDGNSLETSILIPNSLPEIFSVEIDPSTDVEANNTLTCTVDAFDADDGLLMGQYEWLDGDGNSAGIGNTLSLTPAQNRPDDEITCIARVSDNDGATTEFQSNIWIINTEPVVDTATLITANPQPTSTSTLNCSATFSDLNDGILVNTFTWTLDNGTVLSSTSETYTIDTIETNPTDEIICTVSAIDLDGATISSSHAILVMNTAPSIDSFVITPDTNVEANVTLEMVNSISDIDEDTLSSTYTWVDDTGVTLGTGSTLTLDNTRPVGSTITGTLTITDAYGATDTQSDVVTILNTPPTVSNPAAISASPSPTSTGVLTCSASFADLNDGSLTTSYSWTLLDGTPLAAVGNTLTIDPNTTNPTDEIVCTATASDDDGANISSTTSIIVQNTAPSIDSFVITPDTNVEANITLEMVYSNSDIDLDVLTIDFVWTDDTGVTLGTGSTLALDNARPVGSTITGTLIVTDAYGATNTQSDVVTILNTLPVLDQAASISSTPSPKTTGLLTCSAVFSDYNDGNLSPVYTWTLADGTLLQGNSNTYTIDEAQTNPNDEIICTADAADNNGATLSSTSSITIENSNPTVDSFTIAPGTNVEANITLEMQVSYSDVDNQGLNPVYTWYSAQGGVLGSSNILPLNSTYAVGSTLTGTFSVTDINGGTATQSGVVTILNTPPTVSNPAAISASPSPTSTGVLTCSASFADFNDGSLTPSYSWTLLDGTPLAAVGNTLTIDPNTTNPTDEIVCTATASDDDGANISSTTSIVVQNTAPSIDSFVITPDTNVEANVTLEMVLGVSDIDNDTLSLDYNWLTSGGQSLGTGSTLTLNNSYNVGSTITALVTLTDAYGSTDVQSQVVTIQNTDPTVTQPALITATPSVTTGGTLTCSATFTDFNDGSLSPSYTWNNGGVTIGTGTTYSIDSNDASPTDTIQCTASATDNNGATIISNASVVLQNTNPQVNSVTISPSTAYVDDTLTCSYSASDIDSGESQSATYQWSRNNSNSGGTSSTYAGGLSVGDVIGCTVTITDNFGGTATGSNIRSIGNRAPNVSNINLPGSVNSQTDITAIVTSSDPDGQAVTLNYAWYKYDDSVGGSVVSIGSNGPTLAASQFDKHDQIYVEVTPSDGSLSGSTVTSSIVTVTNTLPTTPGVTVSPGSTTTYSGSDLTCSVSTPSTDIDGDSIEYHFEWFNPSGVLESEIYTTSTVDTYLAGNVDQVGTWTCRVTPADDDGSGTSSSDTASVLGLTSCLEYHNAGLTISGVYTLYISGVEVDAYCDMSTDGGGWTLFAITSASQCAESLPYGPNEITNPAGSAYLTTLFKNANHGEFLQDFRANGSNTTFKIIYNFNTSKTVSQRFNNAVSSGESVNWIVSYGSSSYLYTGTWVFSNGANTPTKWNTSGPNFSSDDGIWGAQSGRLDGNSPGPYLSTGGWGHQNNNGGDGNCQTYYYNGVSTSSSTLKSLMFFR